MENITITKTKWEELWKLFFERMDTVETKYENL